MSLQGPIIVVAEQPATDLIKALGAAGAFPIVEAKWSDASTAIVAVKPAAVVIAEPGPPLDESAARMLSRQITTVNGPIIPALAPVEGNQEAAIAIALPIDAALPTERLIARLRSAMRVRALHATVLRRLDTFAAQGGRLPALPAGDALEDATVLILGRGPLYPVLSVAIGEHVGVIGALSIKTAARHLSMRDIDGIVVGDGFSPRIVEGFLTVLAQDSRFREIPVALIGEAPIEFTKSLPNIDHVNGDPVRLVTRMLPLVRLHAFETRLKRMLVSLDADGMFDPQTGLLTPEYFWRDVDKAIDEASERSQALSIARLIFEGPGDTRASRDGARLITRLIRNIDFAMREDDGAILIVFTQTDLRSAHVVARRIANALTTSLSTAHDKHDKIATNITLATLRADDTVDSLMLRVLDSTVVAAE